MSRELDARVAVEVMGLTVGGLVNLRYVRLGETVHRDHIPHYSTEIAAAWEVVEKMQADNPGWRFCLLGGDKPFGMVRVPNPDGMTRYATDPARRRAFFGWRAEFFGHEDPEVDCGQRHASEKADTAPMAICLAALKAVERTPTNSHPEPSAPEEGAE